MQEEAEGQVGGSRSRVRGPIAEDPQGGRAYNGKALERQSHRLLVYLFALGLAHTAFLIGQELFRARALALEKARLEAALGTARTRVERLKAEAEAAQDPLHLEALARRLGFVGKEETLYRNGTRGILPNR